MLGEDEIKEVYYAYNAAVSKYVLSVDGNNYFGPSHHYYFAFYDQHLWYIDSDAHCMLLNVKTHQKDKINQTNVSEVVLGPGFRLNSQHVQQMITDIINSKYTNEFNTSILKKA